jgi:aminoglycoside phosphotransferase (APT) family kinase protein
MLGSAIEDWLVRSGLARADEKITVTPLTGGVSSDILRVDLAGGPICVKRALSRLKVAALWEAPLERNHYEAEWLRIAAEVDPGCVPKLLAERDGIFAMEFLQYPVWKEMLRQGIADASFAADVGKALKSIHAATRSKPEIAARFPTDAIFHAIRIEPYLLATAEQHPDLAGKINELAERTATSKSCLVHGDVSPKNILVGSNGPVFLDAECAWYGDPAFDLAFCLNHLLLKCLWVPAAAAKFLQCVDALAESYSPDDDVERRTASLLPALLLARVDGKSPVEYLNSSDKTLVRQVARPLVAQAPQSLEEVRTAWQRSLK